MHNDNYEKAVLGVMITEPDKIPFIMNSLTKDDFYLSDNKVIFGILCNRYTNNQSFDIILVSEDVKGKIDGELGCLAEMVEWSITALDLPAYIAEIKHESLKRKAKLSYEKGLDKIRKDEDINETINQTQTELDVIPSKKHTQARHISDVSEEVATNSENIQTGKTELCDIKCGLKGIDNKIGGFTKGNVIIIAARPGNGKTSLALNMSYNMASNGKCVLIFSVEMSEHELATKFIATKAEISTYTIKTGQIKNWAKVTDAIIEQKKMNLYIYDKSPITVPEMKNIIKQLNHKHKVDCVFIDYLQRLRHYGKYDNQNNMISKISSDICDMAKQFDIPIILLSQLNRENEKRSGKHKRPTLSDLRDSGSIEQDAHIVIMLHRPNLNEEIEFNHPVGETECLILKNRNGGQGIAKLDFVRELTLFKDSQVGVTPEQEKKILKDLYGKDDNATNIFDKFNEIKRKDVND